jgi:hypothetical protein
MLFWRLQTAYSPSIIPLLSRLPAQLFIPRFHRHSTRRFRPHYTQQLVLLSLLRPLHPYPQDHPYSSSSQPLVSLRSIPQRSQYGYPSLPSHPSPNLPSPNLPKYLIPIPSRARARVERVVQVQSALERMFCIFKHLRTSLRLLQMQTPDFITVTVSTRV